MYLLPHLYGTADHMISINTAEINKFSDVTSAITCVCVWVCVCVCVCVCVYNRLQDVSDILVGTDQRSCVVNFSWLLSVKFHHVRI